MGVDKFMERLRSCRGEHIIIVGHSHFFRSLFRTTALRVTTGNASPWLAEKLRQKLLPNCGVVGLRVVWPEKGGAIIEETVPLFGTQIQDHQDDSTASDWLFACCSRRDREYQHVERTSMPIM